MSKKDKNLQVLVLSRPFWRLNHSIEIYSYNLIYALHELIPRLGINLNIRFTGVGNIFRKIVPPYGNMLSPIFYDWASTLALSVRKKEDNLIVVQHAPQVAIAAADTSFREDSGKRLTGQLGQQFFDADSADTLVFSAISTDENIILSLAGDSLFVQSTLNYFGRGSVITQATDRYGFFARDTFEVLIKPVNDAPVIAETFPDSLQFYCDSSATLRVWDYVEDVESADSVLHYSFLTDIST